MATSTTPAFIQGQQDEAAFAQVQADRARRNAAYNALTQAYGPIAGDPDAYGTSVTAQKLPGELTAQDQANTFNALIDPLKVAGLSTANQQAQSDLDVSRQLAPYKVQEAQNTVLGGQLANTGASLENTGKAGQLSDIERGRQTQALSNAVNMLQMARQRDPGDGSTLGPVFDNLFPTLQKMGVLPANADPGQLRSQIIANPAMLDDLQTSLAAASGGGAPKSAFQTTMEKNAANAITALPDIQTKADQTVRDMKFTTDEARGAVQDALAVDPNKMFGWSSLVPDVLRGSSYNDAKAKLDRVVNVITGATIQRMKAMGGGSTGFGRITNMELPIIQQSLANLSHSQTPEQGKAALQSLLDTFDRIDSMAAQTREEVVNNAKAKAESLANSSQLHALPGRAAAGMVGRSGTGGTAPRPTVGATVPGNGGITYRYLGGDPKSKASWAPVTAPDAAPAGP